MAEETNNSNRRETQEIDLGQLFHLIQRGFDSMFNKLIRLFLYLKKRIVILLSLIILGFLIGYGLSLIITQKQKVEVIVKPNLESKNYLYNIIDEVAANLKARDTLFFRNLGISISDFNGLDILIEPLGSEKVQSEAQMDYLELLQKFENTAIISDVLRAEILEKTPLNHRIVLTYKNNKNGLELAEAIIEYINANQFFAELNRTNLENARERIEENKVLVEQIDQLISNYTDKMAESSPAMGEGKIVLDTEERMDIAALFEMKNILIRDTERKKLELIEQKDPITIINFGRPQQVNRSFFTRKIVQIPLLLIGLFLLLDAIRYLNKKSSEYS